MEREGEVINVLLFHGSDLTFWQRPRLVPGLQGLACPWWGPAFIAKYGLRGRAVLQGKEQHGRITDDMHDILNSATHDKR